MLFVAGKIVTHRSGAVSHTVDAEFEIIPFFVVTSYQYLLVVHNVSFKFFSGLEIRHRNVQKTGFQNGFFLFAV